MVGRITKKKEIVKGRIYAALIKIAFGQRTGEGNYGVLIAFGNSYHNMKQFMQIVPITQSSKQTLSNEDTAEIPCPRTQDDGD
ncbi:MAG: hypothetical protein IJJ13_06935 [Lachnospiraceae bacterium]|nr:hypothetical protein [Lachnospiraceae bacterium]